MVDSCKNWFCLLVFRHKLITLSENCLAGIVNLMSVTLFCFTKKDFQSPHNNIYTYTTIYIQQRKMQRSERLTYFPFKPTLNSHLSGAAFYLSVGGNTKRIIILSTAIKEKKIRPLPSSTKKLQNLNLFLWIRCLKRVP